MFRVVSRNMARVVTRSGLLAFHPAATARHLLLFTNAAPQPSPFASISSMSLSTMAGDGASSGGVDLSSDAARSASTLPTPASHTALPRLANCLRDHDLCFISALLPQMPVSCIGGVLADQIISAAFVIPFTQFIAVDMEALKACEQESARLEQENQALRRENRLLKQQIAVGGLALGAQGNAVDQMAQTIVTQQTLLDHGVQLNALKKANEQLREENQKLRVENQELKGLQFGTKM